MKLLRLFQYDPEHTNPDEVAQHDDGYILILNHRYVKNGTTLPTNRGKLSELQLLINTRTNGRNEVFLLSLTTLVKYMTIKHIKCHGLCQHSIRRGNIQLKF